MVHLERKGWIWGGGGYLEIKIFYFLVTKKKKTQGKWKEQRENSGKTQGIWYYLEHGNPDTIHLPTSHHSCYLKLCLHVACMSRLASSSIPTLTLS